MGLVVKGVREKKSIPDSFSQHVRVVRWLACSLTEVRVCCQCVFGRRVVRFVDAIQPGAASLAV